MDNQLGCCVASNRVPGDKELLMRFGNWNKRRRSQRNPIGGRRAARQTSDHCEHLERRQLLSSTMTFKFNLNTAVSTSAGVYNSNSQLVRTLWSGEKMQPGFYQETWDGNTDSGSPASAGTYTIKLLDNNVKDTWDGVIGNTSATFSGTNTYKDVQPITGMAFNGSGANFTAYTANAYEEGGTFTNTFTNTSGSESPSGLAIPGADEDVDLNGIATDGARIYYENIGCRQQDHFRVRH